MDLAQLLSDALSIITISMCLFLKVPQIRSIYKVKHARGINVCGLLLELASYSTSALYNFVNGYKLLSYLEYPILILQEYVLVFLVLRFNNLLGLTSWAMICAYFGVVFSFMLGILDGGYLTLLIPLTTPVSLSSKALQLKEILTTKNADSVSITTWVLSAVTNASRIYTIYLDSSDFYLLLNFSLSTAMSSLIAVTAFRYQNMKPDKPKTN